MSTRILRLAALAAGIALGLLGGAPGLVRDAHATVNASSNTVTYTGNGSTTVFTVTFPFQLNSDLVVTVASVPKTLGVDYTVSGAGNSTGSVTFGVAPANSAAIVITRTVDYLQKTSLKTSRTYDPATVEKALDKLAMGEQQLQALYTNPPASVLPSNVTAKLNGIRFADQFATIQAAITDAGTGGAVIIPPGYAGSDTFTNPNNIPVIDLRGGSSGWRGMIFVKDLGAICNGVADDTGVFNTAAAALPAAGGRIVLPPANCAVTQFKVLNKPGITLEGQGSNATTLTITGTGGGTCSAGTNGGVAFLDTSGPGSTTNYNKLRGMKVVAKNAALDCLLNVSATTSMGVFGVEDVVLTTSGISAATTNPLAFYTANLYDSKFSGFVTNGIFRQQVNQPVGFWNANSMRDTIFQTNSENPGAGVWNTSNYQASFVGAQGSQFSVNMEVGPNGIYFGTSSSINGNDVQLWSGDNPVASIWMPSTTYALGAYVLPAFTTTGSITTGTPTLTVGSASNLYVGAQVLVAGAGAAGGVLSSTVSTISGTTITLANNASTTVAGVAVDWLNYKGHLYRASIGGTSSAAQPTFPTSLAGTVVDGTVTWREYGPGTPILIQNAGIDLHGSMLQGIAAAAVMQFAGTGARIGGNAFYSSPIGLACLGCKGALVGGNVFSLQVGVLADIDPVSTASYDRLWVVGNANAGGTSGRYVAASGFNGGVADRAVDSPGAGSWITLDPSNTSATFGSSVVALSSAKNAGVITLSSGTPSTGTATVFTGARCVCSNGTTQANAVKCSVSGTTLTATGPNTVTDNVTYACF